MKRFLFRIITIFTHLRFDRFTFTFHNLFLQTNKVLFLLLSALIISSCVKDRIDRRIIILINESKNDIYFLKSENDKFEKQLYDAEIVETNTSGSIRNIRPPWDVTIEYSKNKKLSIYIVIKDSVDKYGWDNVYKKNIFSKKYLIDMQYLEDNKWTIVYP